MKLRTLCFFLGLVFLTTARALGADAFLRLDGIPGESTDVKHPNEIVVQAFTCGVNAAGADGKPVFQPLVITKLLDKASPLLAVRCAAGTHLASAVLTLRKTGANVFEFYKITLTDVVVTTVSQTGNTSGGAVPSETVAFTFGKIVWDYTPQNADGSGGSPVKASWDLAANTPANTP